jgi:chloramphenicol-sensitive protein RarD
VSNALPDRSVGRGVVASIVASVLFGVLFVLPPLLDPLSPTGIFGWRVVLSLPVITVLLLAIRWWPEVPKVAVRMRRRKVLLLALVVDAALLAVQLWLFAWAPATGHGLDAALGYLLLPLVMVFIGLVGHRERLSHLRIAAVASAAIGVACAVVVAGGVSWVTAVVALGYPLYFTLRRRWRMNSIGALWFEMLLMLPAAVLFVLRPDDLAAAGAHPWMGWGIAALGLASGTALLLYLFASTSLSFAVFGLLTYVEPVLLVIAAVALLGEALQPSDVAVYGPIIVALVFLGIDSWRQLRPVRARPGIPRDSAHRR